MKSESKLDPDEQSRHRQLINVTNTWQGKVKLRLPTSEPCCKDKEEDNFSITV